MIVAQILLSVAAALIGRWLQLNPEKIVPQGFFLSEKAFSARLFRLQIAVLGSFFVFGGACGAVMGVLQALTFRFGTPETIVSCVAGVFAAVFVRREVKSRVRNKNRSAFGWWP
jgi:hypothetical protein